MINKFLLLENESYYAAHSPVVKIVKPLIDDDGEDKLLAVSSVQSKRVYFPRPESDCPKSYH